MKMAAIAVTSSQPRVKDYEDPQVKILENRIAELSAEVLKGHYSLSMLYA
jgi:hypothetical protein